MKSYLALYLKQTQESKKRVFSEEDDVITPRPKHRRGSTTDLWREACHTAGNEFFCNSLPSLEEAARLFGYAEDQQSNDEICSS
jgi:hypothetical protein